MLFLHFTLFIQSFDILHLSNLGLVLREMENDIFNVDLPAYHLIQASKSYLIELICKTSPTCRATTSMISTLSAEEKNWIILVQTRISFVYFPQKIHISYWLQWKRLHKRFLENRKKFKIWFEKWLKIKGNCLWWSSDCSLPWYSNKARTRLNESCC